MVHVHLFSRSWYLFSPLLFFFPFLSFPCLRANLPDNNLKSPNLFGFPVGKLQLLLNIEVASLNTTAENAFRGV